MVKNSFYNVALFGEEMSGRFDTKYLKYEKDIQVNYDKDVNYDKLGSYMHEVKKTASLVDGVEYRYYDTSIKSVDEKGKFGSYQIITKATAPSRAKQVAINNTIIVANLKTNKGKAAIVTDEEAGSIVSSGYLMIKPSDNMDIHYLQVILQCEFSLYYLRQIASTGIGISNWSYSDLAKIRLKVPSLDEQQRTLPLVKSKIKVLEDMIKNLEEEKKNDNLQKAIDKIFFEELNLQCDYKNKNITYFAKNFDDINERISFKNQLHTTNTNTLFKKKIKSVCEINSSCVIRRRTHIDGKIIEFKSIPPFSGDTTIYEEVHKSFGSEYTQFKGNDLMFSKMNPQTGNMVLVQDKHNDYYGSAEFWGLIINKDICIPKYLLYVLGTSFVLSNYKYWLTGSQGSSDESTGGRARLSQFEFFNMKIPLPSKEKQQIIINKIEDEKDRIYSGIYDIKIQRIQSIIENDLNKYILNGYSDDLFTLPKEEISYA